MRFPIPKRGFLCKVKEIKGLRGGALVCAAQGIPQIDAEITQKDRFGMETSLGALILPIANVFRNACFTAVNKSYPWETL